MHLGSAVIVDDFLDGLHIRRLVCINDLLNELLQKIFSHLNLVGLARAKRVCKCWLDLVTRASTLQGRNDWQLIGATRVTGDGELHLTELTRRSKGGAIFKAIVEARDEIRLSFQIYSGEGRSVNPIRKWCGDGISLFVVDGSKHDGNTIGPFGSSLGYTQMYSTAGLPHAVIGMGFDEWGNFTRQCEGHDGPVTPEEEMAWTVCLRGPGHGTRGYKYMTHKKVPEWYNVWTTVVIEMIIDKSHHGALNLTMENPNMQKLQVFENIKLPQKVPPKLAFGFASATGEAVNKHYVRNVHIQFSFYGEKIDATVGSHTTFHHSIFK